MKKIYLYSFLILTLIFLVGCNNDIAEIEFFLNNDKETINIENLEKNEEYSLGQIKIEPDIENQVKLDGVYFLENVFDAPNPYISFELDNTFAFWYDVDINYWPIGTYRVANNKIHCLTSDNLYHFTFEFINESTIRFIKEESEDLYIINPTDKEYLIKKNSLFILNKDTITKE